MDCEQSQIWMMEALDGVLTASNQNLWLAHLSTCTECQTDWAAVQSVDAFLQITPLAYPPPNFSADVQARLAQRQAQRRTLLGGIILLTSASALCLFVLFSMWGGRSPWQVYSALVRDVYGLAISLWPILRALAQSLWLALGALAAHEGISGFNLFIYGVGAALAIIAWRRRLLMQSQGGRMSANGH